MKAATITTTSRVRLAKEQDKRAHYSHYRFIISKIEKEKRF